MTSAFDDIMEGLEQAARHAAGEDVPGIVVHVPAKLDVAAIRKKTKLSQPAFANSIGVGTPTLRQWEQGRRDPTGPARVLLAMVERRPGIVAETLSKPLFVSAANEVAPSDVVKEAKKLRAAKAPTKPVNLAGKAAIRQEAAPKTGGRRGSKAGVAA